MSYFPRPIASSELLPTQWFMRWTGYSAKPSSLDGVTRSEEGHPLIASEGFICCSAVLIQNIANPKEVSLLHLFPGVITQGQLNELNRLKAKGGQYRAIFINSSVIKSVDDPEQSGDEMVVGMERSWDKEAPSTKQVINQLLPGLSWHETIKIPHGYWALGYDADAQTMHIGHMTKDDLDHYECFDYGNPFRVTPALQIEATSAALADKGKGRHQR